MIKTYETADLIGEAPVENPVTADLIGGTPKMAVTGDLIGRGPYR